MRRRLAVGLGAAAVTAAIAAPATAATRAVNITRTGFVPSSVTIRAGDTVVWRNVDTRNHQVVADNGAFASPILRPGRRYSFTFRAAGRYRYRDALQPSERGVVVVTGAPPSVSLAATSPLVVYGGTTHLQGVISSRRAGETVSVFAQPYGQASYVQAAVVMTTAGGAFDLVVTPTILTSYLARFRGTTSQPVSVHVRPKITLLPRRKRGFFVTRVTAGRSFAGRWVYLQRRTRFGQWVAVRRLTLGPRSGRIFRISTRAGGTYRIFMTVNQAGVGYLESWSGTQTIRRRR